MKKGKGKFIISITLLLFFLFFGSVVQTQVHEILLGKVGQPLYTLTIIGSGDGTGTVTSNLYGINCTSTVGVESGVCSAQIPMGTSIILTATPSGDHFFDGWSGGGCSGTGTCSITISGNTSVDAKFVTVIQGSNLIAWYRFNEGSGTVVYNKATDGSGGGGLLPNLAVVQNQGLFWTFLSGFGSTPQLFFGGGSGLTDFAWAAQSRTLGGASGGGGEDLQEKNLILLEGRVDIFFIWLPISPEAYLKDYLLVIPRQAKDLRLCMMGEVNHHFLMMRPL